MNVPTEIIQQLVAETVASQDKEVLGVVVVVLGKNGLSIGSVGASPNLDDVSRAMASSAHQAMPSTLIH